MNDQQTLLEKILASTLSIDPGIAIYQRNRWAMAERALSISFPTVHQLLGEGFATLARKFLIAHPNSQADWGDWGAEFPDFISKIIVEPAMHYVSDCAKLDWIIHTIERRDNINLNYESLTLLDKVDAGNLYIRINTNLELLLSKYPLYAIWKMHQPNENLAHWSDIAKHALTQNTSDPEHLVIFRDNWRAKPLPICNSKFTFMRSLKNGNSLATALDATEHTDFNLTEWLMDAVKFHWISSIQPSNYIGQHHE
jgi:Putative DNA-binding domain